MSSPLPVATTDFYKALKALAEGSRVTRLEWANQSIYGVLMGGKVMIRLADDMFHPWLINDGDMAAIDWVTISPESVETAATIFSEPTDDE